MVCYLLLNDFAGSPKILEKVMMMDGASREETIVRGKVPRTIARRKRRLSPAKLFVQPIVAYKNRQCGVVSPQANGIYQKGGHEPMDTNQEPSHVS